MGDREIYEQIRQPLMAFAVSLVGPDHAADLVSEAIVSTLRRKPLTELAHPKAYLMTAVLNGARSRYRRMGREKLALAPQTTQSGATGSLDVVATRTSNMQCWRSRHNNVPQSISYIGSGIHQAKQPT